MRKYLIIIMMATLFLVACENTNKLEKEISEQKNEIDKLKKELKESDEYTSILENNIDEIKSEEKEVDDTSDGNEEESDTIELSPGTYVFGEDIDPGRYTITYQDDNGTIIFHGEESFGENFGMRDGYIYDYTFNAQDGEKLEAKIPVLLFPE